MGLGAASPALGPKHHADDKAGYVLLTNAFRGFPHPSVDEQGNLRGVSATNRCKPQQQQLELPCQGTLPEGLGNAKGQSSVGQTVRECRIWGCESQTHGHSVPRPAQFLLCHTFPCREEIPDPSAEASQAMLLRCDSLQRGQQPVRGGAAASTASPGPKAPCTPK